jgi:hypothetical protein
MTINDSINDKPNKVEGFDRNYFSWGMFWIWIVLPIVVSMLLKYFGFDGAGVESVERTVSGGHEASGFKLKFFEYWYIQIPLHIYVSYKRVVNMGINKWFTILFSIPVINIVLLLWPTKKI